MPKEWTGELVGLMHLHRITATELADKLGISKQYLSMVLNGHREPPDAEQRFRAGLDELIAEAETGE